MIGTNRRRQFAEADTKTKVYNSNWYYIKVQTTTNNQLVNVTNQWGASIKQVISCPEGGTVTSDGTLGFKCSIPGIYELYFTKAVDGFRKGYYAVNSVYDVRLPYTYYTDAASELAGWGGGGTQTHDINFYFLNTSPKNNMISTWAATDSARRWIHLYVPKGSLEAYANYNSTWQTVYNEGRLHEWDFKIIED